MEDSPFDYCILCPSIIAYRIYFYTLDELKLPLCDFCKKEFERKAYTASPSARKLFIELIKQGIPAILEDYDGYKTVDIVVPGGKLHIEVDGTQHHLADYAISDLKRTFYSLADGYMTVRIPNCLVDEALEETLHQIKKMVELRSYTKPAA